MGAKERVNCNQRQRGYKARDKEILIQRAKELHESGYSQVKIAKLLKVSRGTLSRWNKESKFLDSRPSGEAGKLANKRYKYNENYFTNIITYNQAYILGYILGDGTIVDRGKSKRLVMALAEEDHQLLKDIAEELNVPELVKFRKKNSPNEQNKYSLTLNSTKMCNDLIVLGVVPNKSKKEKWIELNCNDLQWCFLRGLFDADGHIRVYNRYYADRDKTYLKARFGITGSEDLLKGVLDFLKQQNIALNINSLSAKQGCYDLYVSSLKDAKTIYHHLYKHGDIKLIRKYEKFSSLMI